MSQSNTRQTVLVTGESGFVASHCVLKLHDAGHSIRATLRSLERASAIDEVLRRANGAAVPVAWFEADLGDAAGWQQAMAGVDYVLHIASPFPRVLPKTPEELIEPARDGALRVLRAAAAAGVKRVVMTSSTAAIVYGRGNIGRPFTEADWSDPDGADNSAYTRSKTFAERAAWDFMKSDTSGMQLTTINPGAVLGPVLEKDYGTSAELVLKLLKGDFPGLPRLGFPLIDVRDVADLHVRAMTHPDAPGKRFLCTNDFMWMEEVAAVLRAHLPDYANKLPTRRLPNWAVRAVALFDPVTRGVTFELGVRRDCDTSLARAVLGFAPLESRRHHRDGRQPVGPTTVVRGGIGEQTGLDYRCIVGHRQGGGAGVGRGWPSGIHRCPSR